MRPLPPLKENQKKNVLGERMMTRKLVYIYIKCVISQIHADVSIKGLSPVTPRAVAETSHAVTSFIIIPKTLG